MWVKDLINILIIYYLFHFFGIDTITFLRLVLNSLKILVYCADDKLTKADIFYLKESRLKVE
jgi:hypothetical protein